MKSLKQELLEIRVARLQRDIANRMAERLDYLIKENRKLTDELQFMTEASNLAQKRADEAEYKLMGVKRIICDTSWDWIFNDDK